MNNCLYCNSVTENPKFCSRSCSAKTNNKIPKRKLTNRCKICKKPIPSRSTYCHPCKYKKLNPTIQDIIYKNHYRASAFALVRTKARAKAKKLGWNKCCVCGYNKHIEIAHIKEISSFPLNTPVNVVNNSNNLLPFCRNCHWEYDHKLIKLASLGIKPRTEC